MILAVDIGNTGTTFGFFEDRAMVRKFKIFTIPNRSVDEYVLMLRLFCNENNIDPGAVEGGALSSVVPPLTEYICAAVSEVFAIKPLVITHGIKTGLNIRIDNHTELGSDIVANAVAAAAMLKHPFAVIDLGTATTITAVNSASELTGVIIIPGTRLSLDALSAAAAELPRVSLESPKNLLGKNTGDSMQSGSVFGTAAMLDGLIKKLCAELKTETLGIAATGGLAEKIIPYCETKIPIFPNLTLEGIMRIYINNKQKERYNRLS